MSRLPLRAATDPRDLRGRDGARARGRRLVRLRARCRRFLSTVRLDQELRSRTQDVRALVTARGAPARRAALLVEPGESRSQAPAIGPDGRCSSTKRLRSGRRCCSTPTSLAVARRGATFARPAVGARPRVSPRACSPWRSVVWVGWLVVGATRENRAETPRALRDRFLLIGGPSPCWLASLAAYAARRGGAPPGRADPAAPAEISADTWAPPAPARRPGTRSRRLGETLNGMLDRLRRGERERRFVADASHELRTPLALQRPSSSSPSRGEKPGELRGAIRRPPRKPSASPGSPTTPLLARSDKAR